MDNGIPEERVPLSPAASDDERETEEIELRLLLEAIQLKYGHDYRHYARASLRRRIQACCSREHIVSLSELQRRILREHDCFARLQLDLSIPVTEMFRDPSFFMTVRREVVPVLRTYPYIKIWHAGCATGEEVYSMAILLKEEGLLERTQIYATDLNEIALQKAAEGVFPAGKIREYTLNYQKSGGLESFADYYTARYDFVAMDAMLKKNMVFACHNLATDGVFGEMNLIACRNVLIYFDHELQERVIGLFHQSLCHRGFLCIGSKEGLGRGENAKAFEEKCRVERIYRRR